MVSAAQRWPHVYGLARSPRLMLTLYIIMGPVVPFVKKEPGRAQFTPGSAARH
jgi:hypothetical protein